MIFAASLVCPQELLPKRPGSSSVDFYKEEITVTVDDSVASIKGIYYFQNNTQKEGQFPVMFPFYVDSLSLFPVNISAYVMDGVKAETLAYRAMPEASSITLRVPLKPNLTTIWRLDYSQKILAPHARYILTSTASWKMPLAEATYRFIVPADWENVTVWPTADTMIAHGGLKTYSCNRKDFMPKQDMEISWRRK